MNHKILATSPEGHQRTEEASTARMLREGDTVLVLNSHNYDTYIPRLLVEAREDALNISRRCHERNPETVQIEYFALSFNGMHFNFRLDQTPESVQAFYESELKKDREAYKASPKGIKAAQEREERMHTAQSNFDNALASLRICAMATFPHQRSTTGAVRPEGQVAATLCDTLRHLINNGDHTGVNYDRAEITNLLQSMGYTKDMHCGDKPETFDRAKTREWIVGQVISCIADDSDWKLLPPFAVTQIEKHNLHTMKLGD